MTVVWGWSRLWLCAGLALLLVPSAVMAQAGPVLRVGMGVDCRTLDPTQTTILVDFECMKPVLETLVIRDPVTREVVPHLATGWSVSEDGRTWRFYLRQGVRFHDGTPFNAEAVKFNIDRFLDPATGTQFISLLDMVEEVTVVNEYTVDITTKFPFAPLLVHLAYPATAISSPAQVRAMGANYGRHPVGTGPYKFAGQESGRYVYHVANPDYWGGPPKLAGIRFIPIVDPATRVAALEAGNIDIAVRIPYHEVERLRRVPGIRLIETQSSRIQYVGINVTRKPLDDVRVRRALNHAVDKQAIVQAILLGNGAVVDSVVGPGAFGYAPVMQYEYDPRKARQLLAEAGYPNGFEVDFYISPGRYTSDGEIAQAVANYLEQIGLRVNLRRLEWSTYLGLLNKPAAQSEHDLFLLGWGWASGDAHQGLTALFLSGEASNRGYYSNPKVDALLRRQAETVDPAERAAVIKQAMEIIMGDAPWIFLVNQGLVTAVRSNVHDVMVPADEMLDLSKAYKVD
ncbi:glutathione ABC transporter substrate-binding protein [Geochorda subterranea]|uniref:Glutathione ABC transporter substrate-binding protein n=1 Tax=Geochorda subterranea TaxID=3109564 RepID=A0ABZ1BTQ7_9FIRM|nr:glutathione ABC transporter substrate-binding protein [Limnochorda sp. LNt]WRP15916.1 glutathione ABC transporter substrate-binding protein [Limnochorda sp. LNt]